MSIQEINDRHLARLREIYREYDERTEAINKKYDAEIERIWRRYLATVAVCMIVPVTFFLVSMYFATH